MHFPRRSGSKYTSGKRQLRSPLYFHQDTTSALNAKSVCRLPTSPSGKFSRYYDLLLETASAPNVFELFKKKKE